jgi:hypothetical protein
VLPFQMLAPAFVFPFCYWARGKKEKKEKDKKN